MSKGYILPTALNVHGCVIDRMEIAEYGNGTMAVQLYSQMEDMPDVYEPYATLSVNLPDQIGLLKEGEFFFKNYSENFDIYRAFMSAGYAEATGPLGTVNFAGTVPVCRLTTLATSKPYND